MSLTKSQRGVAAGMAAGLALTLLGLAGAVLAASPQQTPISLAGRLELLALSAVAPVATLAFSIARLAAHRFHTPEDIDGSGLTSGTERARLLQALLQNTLEQLALALPVYAICAVLAPELLLPALPAAATMFLLGRALFFHGYARGAPSRALGFTLTFYPTILMLIAAVILGFRAALG